MLIVEFKGFQCHEHPVSEWRRWACEHLAPYVSAPNTGAPSSVVKILQDGSRSSEIFLFVKGPLPQTAERTGSQLNGNDHVITCNTCWVSVYDLNKL